MPRKTLYPQCFIDELVSDEDKLRSNTCTLTIKDKVKFKCENLHKIVISNVYIKYGCPLCNFYRR